MIRGELAIRRGTSRHTLVFGGFDVNPNHDAVIRISGKAPRRQAHSLRRRASHACLGSPPPRIVIDSPVVNMSTGGSQSRLVVRPAAAAHAARRITTPLYGAFDVKR